MDEQTASKDLYAILEVKYTATFDEIRKAYHRQLLRYHPDKVKSRYRSDAENHVVRAHGEDFQSYNYQENSVEQSWVSTYADTRDSNYNSNSLDDSSAQKKVDRTHVADNSKANTINDSIIPQEGELHHSSGTVKANVSETEKKFSDMQISYHDIIEAWEILSDKEKRGKYDIKYMLRTISPKSQYNTGDIGDTVALSSMEQYIDGSEIVYRIMCRCGDYYEVKS